MWSTDKNGIKIKSLYQLKHIFGNENLVFCFCLFVHFWLEEDAGEGVDLVPNTGLVLWNSGMLKYLQSHRPCLVFDLLFVLGMSNNNGTRPAAWSLLGPGVKPLQLPLAPSPTTFVLLGCWSVWIEHLGGNTTQRLTINWINIHYWSNFFLHARKVLKTFLNWIKTFEF